MVMINKLIIALCLCLLIPHSLAAGCGEGYIRINTNTDLGRYQAGSIPTLFFDLNDSSLVRAHQVGSCEAFQQMRIIKIVFDGSTIFNASAIYIRLKNNPGRYDVTMTYVYSAITFTKIISYYISDKMAVGIDEAGGIGSGIVLAPNPADDRFRIESEAPLKSVSIFDATGKRLQVISASGNNLTVPLDHYPRGIYLVQVATESERIVLKKLAVD